MSTANSVASGLDCASPESIMDPTNLTPAGDQYSLGCVLYYCVTGQPPFPEGTAAEKMMAHQFKEPAPVRDLNPDVPEALAAVIERLMKKAPEARYPNAAEVVEALRSLAVAPSKTAKVPARPAAGADAPAAAAEPANQAPLPRSAMATMVTMQRPGTLGPRGLSAPAGGPRLPTAGALPSRQSIKKAAATPAPAAAPKAAAQEPQPEPEELQEQQVPGAVDEDEPRSWEERLGPVGITIGALVACALAWFVASRLF
jgi:serine/threonine-protein kinase